MLSVHQHLARTHGIPPEEAHNSVSGGIKGAHRSHTALDSVSQLWTPPDRADVILFNEPYM